MLNSCLWRYILDEDALHVEEINKLIKNMNNHYDDYNMQQVIFLDYVSTHKLTSEDKKKITASTGFIIE